MAKQKQSSTARREHGNPKQQVSASRVKKPSKPARPAKNVEQATQPSKSLREKLELVYNPKLGSEKARDRQRWYYLPEWKFNKMDRQDQTKWHHIGKLLFTDDGVVADIGCDRCSKSGRQCVVYSAKVRLLGSNVPKACVHCMASKRTKCENTVDAPDGWEPSKYKCDAYKVLKADYDELKMEFKLLKQKTDKLEFEFLKMRNADDPEMYRDTAGEGLGNYSEL
ncbi:hypothetical protein CKM354_001270100 [Cercospora kikuchii]|uniref:Uncharacterized protein n=1 Tax=Cercospora kikuchii TaxID=84275 RepID=A0A9P3FMH3_9PEZI|nr:uncharacterized protein CKM354_001270100 [Cercospora kikuchii]GIZ49673.1 hypothetical protein CKM354_001270100 [Cercospora kikuchii]